MTHVERLFEPLQLGGLLVPNRIWMAPLTRNRAQSNGIPNSPSFWRYSDQIHDAHRRQDPLGYGLFDYNRLDAL